MSFCIINFLQKHVNVITRQILMCFWGVCVFFSNSLASIAEQTVELLQCLSGFFLVQITIIYWQCLMHYLMFAEVGETKRKPRGIAGWESSVFPHDTRKGILAISRELCHFLWKCPRLDRGLSNLV